MRQNDPRRSRRVTALLVFLLSILAPATLAGGREAAPTVLYRLAGESSFVSGCIDGPCLCPIRLTYMAGIFGLTPTGQANGLQVYTVSDIDWFTHGNGELWSEVTGSGTYYLGAETQRLVLVLTIDEADPITVDSGTVPRGETFPTIDVAALTDGFCYQDGVDILAAPAASSIELGWVEPAMVTWSVDPSATAYDVVAGDLMQLRATGGDFTVSTAACVADDVAGTAMAYSMPVEAGQAIWFAVRGLPQPGYDSGGEGQAGLRDWEIDASPGSCP